MKEEFKNIKITKTYHDLLKRYCDNNGFKMYKVLEKLIDQLIKPSKKDIYSER